MTGRATNAMLLQGAAPRERGQSTGAFAVRLVAGPRRSTAVHGTSLCSCALVARKTYKVHSTELSGALSALCCRSELT